MPFDEPTYIKAVLLPAKLRFEQTGQLPDYFTRYGLGLEARDPLVIQAALNDVKNFWNRFKNNPKYTPLLSRLLEPHQLSESSKTLQALELLEPYRAMVKAEQQREREARFQDLETSLRLVAGKGYLTPGEWQTLLDQYTPRGLTESELRSRLKLPLRESARQADAPKLSRQQLQTIRSQFAALGGEKPYESLWAFLGVPPLAPRPRIEQAYDAKQREWQPKPADNRKTAANTLLGATKSYLLDGDPAHYENGRLWELAEERLRPQLQLAAASGKIGADEFAQLLVQAARAGLSPEWTERYVQDLLDAGVLKVAVEMPARSDAAAARCGRCFAYNRAEARHCENAVCGAPLYATCAGCAAETLAFDARCAHCGLVFTAGERLTFLRARLASALADRDLAAAQQAVEALQALQAPNAVPPAAMKQVEAMLERAEAARKEVEDALRRPALARALRAIERLERDFSGCEFKHGASGAALRARLETARREANDLLAQARRLEEEKRREDARQAYLKLLRLDAESPDARLGAERCAPPAPLPVRQLALEPLFPAGVRLRPQPVSSGEILILRLHPGASPPRPGARLEPAQLAQLGTPLALREGAALDEAPARGVVRYLAVTRSAEAAVAGACVTHVALPEVEDLQARDFDGHLVLSWRWPEGCVQARVCWSSTGVPDGAEDAAAEWRTLTRAEYEREGGFRLERPRPQPYHFCVFAACLVDGVLNFSGGRLPGCQASLRLAQRPTLRYRVQAPPRWRRWLFPRLILEVEWEAPPRQGPGLVLVGRRGLERPLDDHDGTVLARIVPRAGGVDRPQRFKVDPGLLKPPYSLCAFWETPEDAARFRLLDPPAPSLKVT